MPLFKAVAALWTMHEGKAVNASIKNFQTREMEGAMRAFLKATVRRIPIRTGFLRATFKPFTRFYVNRGGSSADLNEDLAALFSGGIDTIDAKTLTELRKSRFEHARTHNARGEKLNPKAQEARERQYQKDRRQANLRWRKTKAGRAAGKDHRHLEWYYYAKGKRVGKTNTNALNFSQPKDPAEAIKISDMTATMQIDIQISYYRINDFYSRITGAPWRSMDAGFQACLNYLENAAARYPFLTEVLTTQRIYLKGSAIGKEAGNMAADYRRRFGGAMSLSDSTPRGAKMDAYPDSSTKPKMNQFPNDEDEAMMKRLLYYAVPMSSHR